MELVKVRTDYTESPWIKAGKIYEAKRCDMSSTSPNPLYSAMGELGRPFYFRIKKCSHIELKDWEIVKDEIICDSNNQFSLPL